MKTDNLIPAAPLDRRELAPGVQLCFTRLDAPLCPPPLDWPRLLVFDFCRSGRRAIPDGAQYAIVTEGHAAVSFAVPGADFYLPGSQYEALQLFIDPDAVQADSFLTVMGLEIGGIADYFCRDGVHCCPVSEVHAEGRLVWCAGSSTADLFVVIGSSLLVSPANLLPQKAVQAGAKLLIINQDPTPLDHMATWCLRTKAAETLPALVAAMNGSSAGDA